MKRKAALILSAAIALTGCTSATEVVRIDKPILASNGSLQYDKQGNLVVAVQYYTIVTDPEKCFAIVASNTTNSGNFSTGVNALDKVNVNASGGSASTTSIVQLAATLDQLNAQELGAYKAALFGLNTNPTSDDNVKTFWSTITSINSTAAELRALDEKELTKRLQAQADIDAASKTATDATSSVKQTIDDAKTAHAGDAGTVTQLTDLSTQVDQTLKKIDQATQNPQAADTTSVDTAVKDTQIKIDQILPKLTVERQGKLRTYLEQLNISAKALKSGVDASKNIAASPINFNNSTPSVVTPGNQSSSAITPHP